MLHLMSSIIFKYRDRLPAGSEFRDFGMRDEHGLACMTVGNRTNISTTLKHNEDMEYYVTVEERRGDLEAEKYVQAMAVIDAQAEEINTLDNDVELLEEHVHELQLENGAKDTQIAALQAHVAELQAQINLPPPPPDDDDGNDYDDDGAGGNDNDDDGNNDDDDDDARDGAALAQENGEEEEEPDEIIYYISSDEEDTPARNTRSRKRMRMSARSYVQLFNQQR